MEHGIVWEEDVPETIRAVVNAVRNLQEDEPNDGSPEVAAETEEQPVTAAQKSEQPDSGEKPAERKVRHLRVVK